MSVFAHMRRFALPLVIVVAVVAIAVPTCRMVGCDMDMGAMPFVPFNGPHASAVCPGQWELSASPTAIIPTGTDSLILSFLAVAVAAVVLISPQRTSRVLFAYVGDPPPPRHDPRGERFRV